MKNSAISWTNHTWNPVTGCTQIPGRSDGKGGRRPSGCDNCYAKRISDTRFRANPKSPRFGLPFETVLLHEDRLTAPLRVAKASFFFVNSLSDLFHEAVPDEFIERVWLTMSLAGSRSLTNPRLGDHTFQILTKRPDRMRRVVTAIYRKWALAAVRGDEALFEKHGGIAPFVLSNVWLGVSISTQDDVWRAAVAVPAAVWFASFEPLLGPVGPAALDTLDWGIVGGESGPGARPMDEAWARALVQGAERRGVPLWLKQMGTVWARAHGLPGKADSLEDLPSDLRIQRFPQGRAA
jgi:protein gp37